MGKIWVTVLLLVLYCICTFAQEAPADFLDLEGVTTPLKVGEEIAVDLQTSHPYFGSGDQEPQLIWSKEIHHPEASYIAVHFARFHLGPGATVLVRDPLKERVWEYTGLGRANLGESAKGFWSSRILGDTAVVELWSSQRASGFGLAIDRFARGFQPEEMDSNQEHTCPTSDDMKNAICLIDDLDGDDDINIYTHAMAVARLLINGTNGCTGWLLGSEGHLMTNEHCIGNASDAANTDFEFMAEGALCTTNCRSQFGCSGTVEATTSTFIQADYSNYDYSLVQLPTNLTSTYGYLRLRDEGGSTGERIYIPEHPNLWGKLVAYTSDHSADPTGYPELQGTLTTSKGKAWYYYADTEPGSSGSPVIAFSDHLVVGLNHSEYPNDDDCLQYGNLGSRSQDLIAELGANLPNDAVSYDLTVTKAGTGDGTVTATPGGLSCGVGCASDAVEIGNGNTVTLSSSVSDTCNSFQGFSGDADCSDGSITMSDNVSCTATFDVQQYTLDITPAGAGSGTVTSDVGGIDCGATCAVSVDCEATVTLTATPTDSCSTFTGWSGDSDCSDGVVSPNSNVSCTATFGVVTTDSDAPRHAWKLEEAPPIANDEMGIQHAWIFGPTTTTGVSGGALDFDGDDDSVWIGYVNWMQSPSAFSISLWFNRDTDIGDMSSHNISNILLAQSSDSNNDNLEIGTNGSSLKIYLDSSTGNDTNYTVNVGVTNGVWNHMALTYDSSASEELKLFYNGSRVASLSGWSGPLDSSPNTPLVLGLARYGGASNGDYDGQMDEVALFDRALTDGEVADLAATPDVLDNTADPCDVCPNHIDPSQTDTDGDGVGDVCDACPLDNPNDSDSDGVCDSSDICPGFDDTLDSDGDLTPDGCDADVDGDGVDGTSDCDDSDADAWSDTNASSDLYVTTSGGTLDLNWTTPTDPGGTSIGKYRVVRSQDPADFSGGSCVTDASDGDTIASETEPADTWYYLIDAYSACPTPVGNAGQDSSGSTRTVFTCP